MQATQRNWKKRWAQAVLASLLVTLGLGCDKRSEIEGEIYNGGEHEIWRKVVIEDKEQVEFIPTDEPIFKDFRCAHKEVVNELLELALRHCKEE